jgi:ferredoxin
MVRVSIDSDRCQGHGVCYGYFPDYFTADAEGYAEAVNRECSSDARALLLEAAEVCPEHAIIVSD